MLELYKWDNISVKWYKYDAEVLVEPWKEKQFRDAVHIEFSILINWKLKTFWYSWLIKQDTDVYTLEEVYSWNLLCSFITQMWYKISEDIDARSFYPTLTEWLNKIMK